MDKLTKIGIFKVGEKTGDVFTDGNTYVGFCENEAYILAEREVIPTNGKIITVSYDEDAVDRYWGWFDDRELYEDYKDRRADAQNAADDLFGLDLEDELNNIRRRDPFLMPEGWKVKYVWPYDWF